MPELRKRVELANVVAAPPTELVKVPRTASEVEDARVKEEAALILVLLVDVALPLTVQPPDAELKMRL